MKRMSLSNYCLLKGYASDLCLDDDRNPHIEIRIEDGTNSHRIAMNVRSKFHPHDLLYALQHNLASPLLDVVKELPAGMTDLSRKRDTISIDYIRDGLVAKKDMTLAPFQLEGPINDLRDYILPLVQAALNDTDVTFYAFGERWGPENRRPDKYFGFLPGSGIHEIHMNQGSTGSHAAGNGVRQDGALLIHFAQTDSWVGVFLCFQTQSWRTDERTGHPLKVEAPVKPIDPLAPPIVIIGALINPYGREIGRESVTLLNRTDGSLNLAGWQLIDDANRSLALNGHLAAGETVKIKFEGGADHPRLSNKGGSITLVSDDGTVADRVSYTEEQAAREGWTTVF
ncbi:DUF2278 family protein [Roseibium sp.]|uniref:DUF2278 family protein n=1 Tax=Roseibium sp. TaxID=1936156 RepID=UPI003A987FF1